MGIETFLKDSPTAPVAASPRSFRVGTQLMQDTVSAAGLLVPRGPGKVALFANPFNQNREEALVIDPSGNLNYVHRSAKSATGWDSTKVYSSPDAVMQAQQVVVAVHPSGVVWAFCVPPVSGGQVPTVVMLRLGLSADGATCSWTADQSALQGNAAWESVGVSYSPEAGPLVYGGCTGATTAGKPFVQTISALIPASGLPQSWVAETAVPHTYMQGVLVGAGYRAYSQVSKSTLVNVFYIQQGSNLYRLDQPLAFGASPVSPFSSTAGALSYNTRQADGSWAAAGFQPVPGTGLSKGTAMTAEWLSVCTPGAHNSGNTKKPVYAAVADGSIYVYDLGGPTGGWEEVPEFGVGLQTWGEPLQVEIAGLPDGTYQLLARGLDSFVYFYDRTLVPGTQQPAGWTPVPGLQQGTVQPVKTMAVTAMPDGSVQVLLASASANALFLGRWKADGTWDEWAPVPGIPAEVWYVSLAAMPDGSTQATAVNSNDVYHAILSASGSWSSWNGAGGANAPTFAAPVSITAMSDGQAQLAGISNGSVVHRVRHADGSWQDHWLTVPGGVQGQYESATCIAGCADGSAFVVARSRGQAQLVSGDVKQFCGVWNVPDVPHDQPAGDIGCVYLNGNGDVVTGYLSAGTNPSFSSDLFVLFPVVGLQFDQATSWQDADGMLHVYANAGGDLRVVHQNGWKRYKYQYSDRLTPAWVQAAAVKIVNGQPVPLGFSTTVATGLRSEVANFWLDTYPDYKPSELVQSAGKPAEEAFSILTQDVTSTTWVDDSIRLPGNAAGDPYIISRYVAESTLLDNDGIPMLERTVVITAEELTQVYLHGVSYLVGPAKTAAVATDYSGKITVSVDADNLTPPKVILHTDGLANGTVIDFGAQVNNFLAGTGTLPSQQTVFTPTALKDAQVVDNGTGQKVNLVPADRWTGDLQPATVVNHCQLVYGMASGTTPQTFTMTFDGFDTPQPVVGYVFQNWDPDRPRFQAFRTVEELEAYHAYRDSHPAYGGFWDDFLHWAGDVWEGIKTAATKIAEVVVDIANKVVEIAIHIGEAVVSLGKMIIKAVEQAARAVEAVFQMIADAVVRVIEWLKSLFSFKDIWETTKALDSMVRAYVPWLTAQITHFQPLAHGWFEQQEAAIDRYFASLKAQFSDARLGDSRNKIPPAHDAGGAPIDQDSLQSNPQANWMMNQLGVQSATAPEALNFVFTSDPIAEAFDKFISDPSMSAAITSLSEACDSIARAVESLLNGDTSPIVPLLEALQSIAKAVLQGLDAIVQGILTFSAAALGEVLTFLFTPQTDLGFINTIYRWVQKQAQVPDAEIKDASIGGLVLLVAGFMGTVVYKLAMGVENPPFPDGYTLPAFTSPASADGDRLLGSPAANTSKMTVNASLNIPCAFISTGANLLTDIGVDTDTKFGKIVQGFGIGSCFLGAVTYFPLLYADDADAPGIIQCVGWGVYALLNVGAAIPYKGRLGCAFKNFMNRTTGPVATTVIGLGLLGVSIWDCVESEADPMTWSSDIFGCTSMIFQFLRCFKVKWLDVSVTAVDAVSNLITFLIPGIEALCELANQPEIIPSNADYTLDEGTVGMTYSCELTATSYYINTGYGQAQEWALVQDTSLPDELKLDPQQGVISGTPTDTNNGQSFAFTVQCCDTFSPPGYSDPTPFTLTVNSTKATGLDLSATAAQLPTGTVAANLLTATVSGATGNLQGYTVRFTAPASGGSGVFLNSTSSADISNASTTIDVTTDANGQAVAPFYWANGIVEKYEISAQVPGVPATLKTIAMENTALTGVSVSAAGLSSPQTVYILIDPRSTQRFQSAGSFPYPITAKVVDSAGNPMPNVIVTFVAPADSDDSRYGVFVNNSSTTISVVTDGNGLADAGVFSGANISLSYAPTVQFTVTAATNFGPSASFSLQYVAR